MIKSSKQNSRDFTYTDHKYTPRSSTWVVTRKSSTGDIAKLVTGDSTKKQSISLQKQTTAILLYNVPFSLDVFYDTRPTDRQTDFIINRAPNGTCFTRKIKIPKKEQKKYS